MRTRTRLIRIGNSRGVWLPKPMIEEAGLEDQVEVIAGEGVVTIKPLTRSRAGWAEAVQEARRRGDDRMLAQSTPTRFDETEWQWEA